MLPFRAVLSSLTLIFYSGGRHLGEMEWNTLGLCLLASQPTTSVRMIKLYFLSLMFVCLFVCSHIWANSVLRLKPAHDMTRQGKYMLRLFKSVRHGGCVSRWWQNNVPWSSCSFEMTLNVKRGSKLLLKETFVHYIYNMCCICTLDHMMGQMLPWHQITKECSFCDDKRLLLLVTPSYCADVPQIISLFSQIM